MGLSENPPSITSILIIFQGHYINMGLSENPPSDVFKFMITDCWCTPVADPTFSIKDDVFIDGCPVDDSVRIFLR